MAKVCEITRKRTPHLSSLPEDQRDPKTHQRKLLKRSIKVPEIKGSVNLKVSEAGIKLVKSAGGLAKFLKETSDEKLIPKLLRLKRKIHGEPVPEKSAEEQAAAAPATEKKPEAKPKEAKAEAAPEKPKAE